MNLLTTKKYFFPILIFLTALSLRLIYLYQIKDNVLLKHPKLDAEYYDTWAQEIIKGDWISKNKGTFLMSPGYPYFLSLVYLVYGHNFYSVILIQFLFGSLICVLIYFLGEKLFNKQVGIISGLISCFYSISFFYEGMLFKTTLINLFNIVALILLIIFAKNRNKWYLFLSGVLLAISSQFRPNILIFIPFILIWLILYYEQLKFCNILIYSVSLIIGIFIILLPVGIRNYVIGKEFVLTTAHGGMNFYTGNNPYTNGRYNPLPFTRSDPKFEQNDFLNEAILRSGKQLTRAESSKFWYNESLKFIRENPIKWIQLLVNKFIFFWNSYEDSINIDYYFFRETFNSLLKFLPFTFGLITPFSLLGIYIILLDKKYRDCPELQILLLYISAYLISALIYFPASEYRFPVVPILIIFASFTVYDEYNKIKQQKKIGLIELMLLILFVLFVNSRITDKKNRFVASYISLGNAYEEEGLYDKAIKSYKKSIQLAPDCSTAYLNLGMLYSDLGAYNESIEIFKKGLQLNPNKFEYELLNINLSKTYIKTKKYEEAEKILKLYDNFDGHFNLAILYEELGKTAEAIKEYENSLILDSKNVDALSRLGDIYAMNENFDKAVEVFKKAIELYPNDTGLINNLGTCYVCQKKYDEALKIFRKLLEINPNNYKAQENYKFVISLINKNLTQKTK